MTKRIPNDLLDELIDRAFADLADEHPSRVLLSNLVPSGSVGVQRPTAHANTIVFDFMPGNRWNNRIRTILGITPGVGVEGDPGADHDESHVTLYQLGNRRQLVLRLFYRPDGSSGYSHATISLQLGTT